MNEILVSVILLVYNHEKYLSKAIDSIIVQKHDFPIEILIANDCSSDGSKEIIHTYVDKFPSMIRSINNPVNLGGPKNYYNVMMNCQGKYIAFLEGDDFWTDEYKLKTQIEFLESNLEIIGIGHRNIIVDQNDKVIGESSKKIPTNKSITKKELLKHSTNIAHPSTLVYRNVFRDPKFYIISKSNTYGTHFIMLALLHHSGGLLVLDRSMSAWRKVVSNEAENFTSRMLKAPLEIVHNSLKMIENMETFFKGYFNFSHMKARIFANSIYSLLISKEDKKWNIFKQNMQHLGLFEKILAFFYFWLLLFPKILKKIGRIIKYGKSYTKK